MLPQDKLFQQPLRLLRREGDKGLQGADHGVDQVPERLRPGLGDLQGQEDCGGTCGQGAGVVQVSFWICLVMDMVVISLLYEGNSHSSSVCKQNNEMNFQTSTTVDSIIQHIHF